MPKSYDAIVIGSGLGGLTAGALYARTGANVLLLERNKSFGGAATTYRHGALTVEASLHETTNPEVRGDPKHDVFEALDLEEDIEFLSVENFHEVRCPLIGEPFRLPHGLEAVETQLVERFPAQRLSIRAFLRQLKRTLKALEHLQGHHSVLWRLAHAAELPLELWAILRDIRSSLSDVMARYFGDNEAIKFALAANLPYFADDPDKFWWLGYAVPQGYFLVNGGYYIKGGSQSLSNRLVEIIREEGGDTLTECEATAIELDPEGRARGVRYRSASDDAEIVACAPVIFANAAPHVIEGMLPEDHRQAFMEPYNDRPLSISLFSATLGLNRSPAEFGISSYSTMLIPAWMERLSDYKHSAELMAEFPAGWIPAMCVVDYSQIDSGLTAGDVFPLNVVCADRLKNWEGLSVDAYRKKKDSWTDAIVRRLDEEWPGIAAAVVDRVVATARTMQEYLNTPGGAVYGFEMRPPKELTKGPPGQVETSISGLWLASAFAFGGGFTGTMAGGAAAAKAALGYAP
ncbi:MAG: NAD(P)/FAD-dependent oxidoreductase [Pleurocapsa sp. MO_226.B13]|nr:NAD(P)/FAD-dependent oxidoreductase [Pleurocapsa sp. MO_226.B13]